MKARIFVCIAILLAMASIAMAGGKTTASANCTLTHPVFGNSYTLVFNASAKKNGRATGAWSYTNANNETYSGVVDCLHIEGNKAWFSGVINRADNADWLIGGRILLRVTDNGTSPGTATNPHAQSSIETPQFDCEDPYWRSWIDDQQAGAGLQGDFVVSSGFIKVG
jgi:hypothetical protein